MAYSTRVRSVALATAVAILTASVGGCVSTGPFNGAVTDDPMEMLVIGTADGSPVTPDQYMAIQSIARYWMDRVDIQIPGVGESAFAGCVGYGVGYALGGATQGLVYAGADAGAGAAISGVTGCMGGIVNGYVSYSNARSSMVGTGTADSIYRLAMQGDPLLGNIVVVTSLVRTKNHTNAPADGVVQGWNGPTAGSSTQVTTHRRTAPTTPNADPAQAPNGRPAQGEDERPM